MKRKALVFFLIAAIALSAMAAAAGCQKSTTLLGQVTAIEGNTITLALGTQNEAGEQGAFQPGAGEDGTSAGEDGTTRPEPPDGMQPPSGEEGEMPEPPEGMGEEGSMPPGGAMGPGGLTLTGEESTITVSDSTVITIEEMGETTGGSLSDIDVGDILSVTLDGGTATTVTVMQGGGGGMGEMEGSSAGSIELTGVYTVDGTTETSAGETCTSDQGDENVVLVTGGGDLTLAGATLNKSGDTSSANESNFYGLNAVLAVADGSTATVTGTTLTSSAEGANGIFTTGEGSVITAENVKIYTSGNSSRGLDATYGGTINAADVEIVTEGAHCAPIATDRGEGTITVEGGTLSAAGGGSPCIYSTGDITVIGVTGTATGSQAAVVEGKNSITLTRCILTGAGENGVMLYQSTSGDAAEGTASFNVTDCTLITTSSGPMFYVTNTDAEATLTGTTLEFGSGILAEVAGNDTNNWGTPGSNGGNFTLTGVGQVLDGDILCDGISTVSLLLTEGSVFTGAVNEENAGGEVTVSLDASSQWNVTGTSYVTVIENASSDCSNINSNGNTIYYDVSNSANDWLDGKTISLPGGGSLTPA
ncbi:MAG: hypothetical protein JW854_05035 [Actinobacteria bacterium]|nr:hypothetical protein [Actinomycetota bacterium]